MGLLDKALDASIFYSFDASGFARHAEGFHPRDLQRDLDGQTALITGANSGIGFETARALARRRARVILVCRSQERGAQAKQEITLESGNPQIQLELCDLSSLAQVRALVQRLELERLDLLIHNAGVLPRDRQLTEDGLELTFQVHVAAPFLLTELLLPKLGAGSRVLWVSSGGMYPKRLSLRDVDWAKRKYDGVAAYAQTKRMQVVMAGLMAERYRERGVIVHSMHPGWADTPAVRSSIPGFHKFMGRRLRTAEQGADTLVWLAVSEAAGQSTGEFWFDRQPRSPYLLPFTRESAAQRQALWQLCQRVTRQPARSA